MTQYCPYTETCAFYPEWEKRTKKYGRKDVIVIKEDSVGAVEYYNCLPLMDLCDSEMGIPMIDEQRNFTCSHLTLLNLLSKLNK
jgi:hypothetical protein